MQVQDLLPVRGVEVRVLSSALVRQQGLRRTGVSPLHLAPKKGNPKGAAFSLGIDSVVGPLHKGTGATSWPVAR